MTETVEPLHNSKVQEIEHKPQWLKAELIDEYCRYVQEIKPDKSQGVMKIYQPTLLLSIIDLIEQNFIQSDKRIIFDQSDTLINTFYDYLSTLSVLSADKKLKKNLWDPLFALEGKEHFFDIQYKKLPKPNKRIESEKAIKQFIGYLTLNNNFFNVIKDRDARKKLVDVILNNFFSLNPNNLDDSIDYILKINQSLESRISLDSTKFPKKYLRMEIIREPTFKKGVIKNYGHKCAMCGIQARSLNGKNIVDSAHIKPLATFNDNKLDNGICLCKNHHWAFDQGLFTIDKNYKIIVSSTIEETSPNSKPIQDFHGTMIYLPKTIPPRKDALQWHNSHVFIA